MTLRQRLDRLEGRKPLAQPPAAIVRPVVTPGDSGPEVVAALARRAGEPWRHIDRESGEAVDAFTARAMAGASGGHWGGYRRAQGV